MAQVGPTMARQSQHLENNRRHPWYLPASPLDSLMALVMGMAMAMAVPVALLGLQQLVVAGHVELPNSHYIGLSNEMQPLSGDCECPNHTHHWPSIKK